MLFNARRASQEKNLKSKVIIINNLYITSVLPFDP